MKEYEKIINLISTLREKCPSDKIRTSEQLIECLKEELGEVEAAIKNQDRENLAEELGDLLFNVLFLIDMESKKNNFDIEDTLEKLHNKMIFRHPHVFENPREVTIEEADIIWTEQKKKEKELKIIH